MIREPCFTGSQYQFQYGPSNATFGAQHCQGQALEGYLKAVYLTTVSSL